MKILALADEESKYLWDYFEPEKLAGIDLVLACGDLSGKYLSFIATFTPAPVLYVHGNHDKRYVYEPPEGCVCVEDTVYNFCGVRILGLGGSMRYRPGPFQYSEKEMARRVARVQRELRRAGGMDILITHAPLKGVNDGEDLPHQGFACFHDLVQKYTPKVMVHGHMHLNYGANLPRVSQYGDTQIINAFERYIFELDIPLQKPWQKCSAIRKQRF